jgi:hypothetical protein
MFPEGLGRPKAAPRVGKHAPFINALLVNSKSAVDKFWKQRGYVTMKAAAIKARLGYALDREEAKGYILTAALGRPLLSPEEARCIGKRIDNSLGAKGALGKELAEHKKRGTSAAELLQAAATLSLAPPARKTAAPTPPAEMPPAPPPPEPSPPPPTDADAFADAIRTTLHPPRPPCGNRIQQTLEDGSHVATAAFVKEIESSLLVGKAIVAAYHLEQYIPWERDDDDEEEPAPIQGSDEFEVEEETLLATIKYKYALKRLDVAYPGFQFGGVSGVCASANETNSMPCHCGEGRVGRWPWQLQPETRGFSDATCDCMQRENEREQWLRASMGAAFDPDWWQCKDIAAKMIRLATHRPA